MLRLDTCTARAKYKHVFLKSCAAVHSLELEGEFLRMKSHLESLELG